MAVNHGYSKGISLTMAAGAGSATVNVLEGFQRCYLQVSTLSSGSAMDVYASADGGTTYYQLRHMQVATASSQSPTFIIAATAMANGAMVPIPAGFQYYKIVCTDSNPSAAFAMTLLGNT